MIWEPFGQKALDFIRTPIKDDARINILEGSVRSGKTVALIPKWLNYIHNGPKGRLLQFGVSKQTIKTNVLNDLFDTVGASNYRYNKQSGELRIYKRELLVVGLKDEGSEKYLRGSTFAGANGDEVTMTPESSFKQILNRMSVEGAKLYGTTNPDSPYHYLYTDYLTNEDKLNSGMVKRYHFGLEDNPSLSREYVDFISKAYSGLWYKRMILGLWVMAEGAIYDMYSEAEHNITADQLPKHFDRIMVGVDYGDANPTVFLKIGVTHRRSDGEPEFWIYDEYYHDSRKSGSKTVAQYKAGFVKFVGNDPIDAVYPDPSALGFIHELRSDSCGRSFRVEHVNNAVLPGINSVATPMTDGRYHIVGKRCPNLSKEKVSYIWDINAQKRGEDKPLKENDHACDAERYPIHTKYPAASFRRVMVA